MAFGRPQTQNSQHNQRRKRRPSSDYDSSDGEEIPEFITGPIEIPKAPSHPESSSSRRGSTPGMKAPTHIDFSTGSSSPRNSFGSNSAPQPHFMQQRFGQKGQSAINSRWPQQIYRQWFGAITEGRSIQVHSILADYPDVLDMRRNETTPFHMALTQIASTCLGNDTTGMDGLQVAIMGYKNAYANWRLGNGAQVEQMAGMSADQMKEHVAVREVILGALIDAISPEQLDTHFFGRQQNTTLHLAAFYNDANLVERLLRQGAAVDIPNRMGKLPLGITNDEQTQQWLAMYQGQVRGTRYQAQPSPPQDPPQQLYQDYYGMNGDAMHGQYAEFAEGADRSPEHDGYHYDHSGPVDHPESELQMENSSRHSDDGDISVSSYIKQFGDQPRSLHTTTATSNGYVDHDGASDDDYDDERADNVSVASSSDRLSLGLGGVKGGISKSQTEPVSLRQRVLDDQQARKGMTRDNAPSITTGTGSETANSRPESPSISPSVLSYHTANGAVSEDGNIDQQNQTEEGTGTYLNIDSTLRIKVDPNTIDDDEIDDIFSDTDDIVQMEPSYCQDGSGLSDSPGRQLPSQQQRPESSSSAKYSSITSSASITMQSLSNAMAQSSLGDGIAQSNMVISAFPVMVQNTPVPQPHLHESVAKSNQQLNSVKQQELSGKDANQNGSPRPSSPFLMRESLYEMIMARSPSRASGSSSVYSIHSNAVSNSSTIAVSRDHPSLSEIQSQLPTSPTSPTSMCSQPSPQSTSFEDPNAQSSQSAATQGITSESLYAAAASVAAASEKPSSPMVPDSVIEECVITPAESLGDDLPSAPTTGVSPYQHFETAESNLGTSSDSEAEYISGGEAPRDAGFDTRSSSPVPQPRPTAASLFNFMQDTEVAAADSGFDAGFDADSDSKPASATKDIGFLDSENTATTRTVDSAVSQDEFPPLADSGLKAFRIGRRQGRATAGILQDEENLGFSSEPSFDFVSKKLSASSLADKSASRTDVSEGEPESPAMPPQDMPELPANVPLTRDKRDQYLMTLISRNTVRGAGANGSPKGKRAPHAAITHAMRAASPARSFSSTGEVGSGDDGDAEPEQRGSVAGRTSRHVSMRSEGAIDPAVFRPPSALGNRDILDLSGASINGRIRANTMGNSNGSTASASKPVTPTRKVSPSLATLKTRNLVSNSPAKQSTTPTSAEPQQSFESSNNRVFALSNTSSSRVRAMSTPAEARPPSALASPSNSARIGRVAALSQNFERQKAALGPPPKIAIPGRASTSTGNSPALLPAKDSSLGAVSAPLGGTKLDFSKPVARSSSISSSHSTGAHGQSTTAGSSHAAAGGAGSSSQGQGRQQQRGDDQREQQQPTTPTGGGGNSSSNPGGSGNGGNGDDGDNGSSPSLSVSVIEPNSTDSNGSTTTSHTDSSSGLGRGLAAASMHGDEGDLGVSYLDSRGSADQLGSSIFSSIESRGVSSIDVAPLTEPAPALHAPVASRRDAEAERKSRFKELANRRKSGTLERISNRGLVKSRKALIDSSAGSMVRSASPAKSSTSSASSVSTSSRSKGKGKAGRVQFAEPTPSEMTADIGDRFRSSSPQPASDASVNESVSFFDQQGGGRSFRDAGAIDDAATSSSRSNVDLSLEELQQASMSALHPESQLRESPYSGDSSIGRSGINTDYLIERSRSADPQESLSGDATDPIVSRTSSSGKSKSGSGSGDDSIHILSSLDTISTPGSTPLDSTQENTHVGLLAQYNMNQIRMDKRHKRQSGESEQSYISSGQESQSPGRDSDVELGFHTLSDLTPRLVVRSGQTEGDKPEPVEQADDTFDTMMPERQRQNPRALFGLSTVVEEEEYSRNPSMVTSDSTGAAATQKGLRSSAAQAMPSTETFAAAVAAFSQSSSSTSTDIPVSDNRSGVEMQERRYATIRSSSQPLAPVYQGLGAISVPDAIEEHASSPEPVGLTQRDFEYAGSGAGWTTPLADDDTHSRAPSYGSHSFDPNIVFGYTSEENNSTMASRSSFDRSDIFNQTRPGSSASRILYMHPIDQPASEGDGYVGDNESRTQLYPSSPLASGGFVVGSSSRRQFGAGSFSSIRFGSEDDVSLSSAGSLADIGKGKGKAPVRRMPEMEQITPRAPRAPEHVLTVEEVDEDATTDEEPIPLILYVESQDFEGYVPLGYQIQQEREEYRKERRAQKEARKKGITLPPPPPPPKVISPLWFMENNYLDPLPPDLLKLKIAERDMIEVENMGTDRITENPDKKRILESASISSIRLRQELDDFIAEDDGDGPGPAATASHGTIKPLVKRPRVSNISTMFDPPTTPPIISPPAAEANAYGTRKSFLDSIEIPVSDIESGDSSDDSVDHAIRQTGYGQVDEAFVSPISQEFQVPGHELYREPMFPERAKQQQNQQHQQHQQQQTPRKRLVLRAKAKTFSEQVMEEVNGLNIEVRTDNQGTVRSISAGQFAYDAPNGTVRPSMIPQYVSQLNGAPAGPFFMPPKASAKSGYLYMRILGIEDIEDKTDSVYFVIRNGIDTLATTPVTVGGQNGTTINQEFRILADPNISITMWMRFRSDAIIYKGGRGRDAGCMPPLLRKLVRRNTRSRNKWNCANPADSEFDFGDGQSKIVQGGRRDKDAAKRGYGFAARPQRRPTPLQLQQQQMHNQRMQGGEFPERISSAFMNQPGTGYASDRAQQIGGAFNDPRSLNATQAPSSVFYEPGTERLDSPVSHKGLAQAKFKEETRGVAVVHIGEMIEEVFLRGLVDSWDVENVWESRKGARLQLQLFYIPECPLFREEELPKTLTDCEMAMEVCNFHNRTLNSGYMSQRGGDTRFWRRRYFRLIGGFLFAYHEDTKEPRCFIDLNDATRVVDHQNERSRRQAPTSPMIGGFGNADLVRSTQMRRRMTHKRNNSDHSSRDGAPAPTAAGGIAKRRSSRHYVSGLGYASDSEPADMVDIADPALQQSTMKRRGNRQQASAHTDSGVISMHNMDGSPDSGMQHSFSIEFGEGGSIEFYTETENEKRVWVEIVKRVVGNIPKIPSWLIKLLHADVSERIETDSVMASGSSLATSLSTPSSKFEALAHPYNLY
ncbi:Bud site selection protein bud4 [Coemansia erecta]|uniref:Bud site selection protein bud4 n=1 Tax=Coemansia erecta TaxID=147472 RepID=A0A9W7Y2D5_9FUNG|nr:Bud site selection protein bud4 [Coemansia erecta]